MAKIDVAEFFTRIEEWSREHADRSRGAHEVTTMIEALRKARESGDMDSAIAAALSLGLNLANSLADLAGIGLAVEDGAKRGGRKPGSTAERDEGMAREFLKRRATATCTDTALKRSVGTDYGLSRTQAIEAINRGLKKVSA